MSLPVPQIVIVNKLLHLSEYPSPHLCERAHDVCSAHQGGCGHDLSGDHTSLARITCYNITPTPALLINHVNSGKGCDHSEPLFHIPINGH